MRLLQELIGGRSRKGACKDLNVPNETNWIENLDGSPGKVWLNNAPSFEKGYKAADKTQKCYAESKMQRHN